MLIVSSQLRSAFPPLRSTTCDKWRYKRITLPFSTSRYASIAWERSQIPKGRSPLKQCIYTRCNIIFWSFTPVCTPQSFYIDLLEIKLIKKIWLFQLLIESDDVTIDVVKFFPSMISAKLSHILWVLTPCTKNSEQYSLLAREPRIVLHLLVCVKKYCWYIHNRNHRQWSCRIMEPHVRCRSHENEKKKKKEWASYSKIMTQI